MVKRAYILALLLVTMFAPAALAQTAATLSGTVHDPSNAILPGVTVTARSGETGLSRTSVSGPGGRFVIPQLPPGTYEIRAELNGFKPHVRPEVRLAVAQSLVLNITLQIGDVAIMDVVTAHIPTINTATSELSYLVTSEQIEQIPLNGRNYTDLALLQPGVNSFPHRDGGSVVAHGLGMSINGQDPRSNTYLLDGTLTNDFTNGPTGSAAGTALGLDTIREFRVQSNAYSSEYGRNSGGQINVLTKSGTNRLSGSAFEYHRNDAMDAKSYFDTKGKPNFHRNQFGLTAGGPIKTDKAFFFVGYEALIERLGKTISTVVPDENARLGILPSGVVPVSPLVAPYLAEFPHANGPSLGGGLAEFTFPFDQKLDEHFLQGRVDYNANPSRQFFGRYTIDDASQFLPTDFPQFPREFFSRNQFFTGEYRQIFSNRTLNTARLGFSRTRIGQNIESNTTETLPEFVPGRGISGAIDIGGMKRFGPQSSANLRLVQNVFSLQDDLVHTRGRHTIKAGGLIEHYQDNMVNPTFSLGIYRFASINTFLRATALSFVGLTPEAQFDRYWNFTLFGALRARRLPGHAEPHRQRRSALRVHDHAEGQVRPRLGAARPDRIGADDRSALRQLELQEHLAARRLRLGHFRRRPHGAAWRLRALLQHQQPPEPDRHGDQSAGDAATRHPQSDVPEPAVRPGRRDLDSSRAVGYRDTSRPRVQPERAA